MSRLTGGDGGRWLEQWAHDGRLAFVGLRRAPGFAAATILTLALGIGAATSLLTVAYSVLFVPLPVRDPSRVVVLTGRNPNKQPEHFPLSGPEFSAFARETRTLSTIAAVEYHGAMPGFLHLADTVTMIRGSMVTGNFFAVLGSRALVGRLLGPDDDRRIIPTPVVISEPLWRNVFGADSSVVGRSMQLGITAVRIVGVAANGLDYPRGSQMWLSYRSRFPVSDTVPGYHDVLGRLAAGRSTLDAQRELGAFLRRPDEPHSDARALSGQLVQPVATPLSDVVVGDVRPVFAVVAAAVGLLLLVTCVNVANLMLVRMLARRRELAVRAALGASAGRIAAHVMMESAVLATAGGAIGIAAAWYAVRLFAAFAPPELPRVTSIAIALPPLAAAIGLCVCVTFLFGLVPALASGRLSLADGLRERGGGGTTAITGRLRAWLVGAQVAMAVSILVVAATVARGFDALARRNLGFRPEHLIVARIAQTATVGDASAWNEAAHAAIRRVGTVPGVVSATGVTEMPFHDAGNDVVYSLPGDTPGATANRPLAAFLGADKAYFKTLGIVLRRGRELTDDDRGGAAPVAVVDELLARQAWPNREPIGQRIGIGSGMFTVVGVVAPTRYRDLLAPRATVYIAHAQTHVMYGSVVPLYYIAVRTTTESPRQIDALRTAVRESDARLFLADIATITDRIDGSLATRRLSAVLLAAFAAAVLLLTALGLYNIATTFVRYREFEIGVRVALGATPSQVSGLVVRQGVVIIAAGAIAGIAGALLAGTAMRAVVVGVSVYDLTSFVTALVTVGGVAAVALAIPAHRASRVNPVDVLRRG